MTLAYKEHYVVDRQAVRERISLLRERYDSNANYRRYIAAGMRRTGFDLEDMFISEADWELRRIFNSQTVLFVGPTA